MSDKLFTTFAFLGFILVLIPLPWHLHAWNAGTCLFMVWTAIGCLIHFVNSIVWDSNLELHSAVWCDIATKLIVGLSVALPCASLCINRRLYSIARVSQVHTTQAEKRRAVYVDVAIGVGFPIIVMALHYIVQGHRFDIFEDIGCWPATVNMPPAYPLVWMWPILIGLISMVFCCLSLREFMRRRKEFNELLATNASLNVNRYFRLMALATLEITTTTPIAIYFVYLNLTTTPPIPWVSLADTHFNFSRIQYVPAFIVNSQPQLKLNFNLNRWLFPACALAFFAFFGLAEEARRNYKIIYCTIVKPFGIIPPSRPTISRAPKASINLSSTYTTSVDGRSEPGGQWDELSLKMPEIMEDIPPAFLAHRSVSFADHTKSTPFSQVATSPALKDELQRSASLYSSDSSSFTAAGSSNPPSPTHAPIPPVPALTITRPDNELFDSSPTPTPYVAPAATQTTPIPPAMRRDLSPSPSRQSHYRQSTSSDCEIIISPAYFPDATTSSRYEEAFGNREPSDATPHLDSARPPPHGGIYMTVEKSIV